MPQVSHTRTSALSRTPAPPRAHTGIFDNMRAIDLLASLNYTDDTKVGMVRVRANPNANPNAYLIVTLKPNPTLTLALTLTAGRYRSLTRGPQHPLYRCYGHTDQGET